MKKKRRITEIKTKRITKIAWFFIGAGLGLFFTLSFLYIAFERVYKGKIYPGVKVAGVSFSGKAPHDVQDYFEKKNAQWDNVQFKFVFENYQASIYAKDLKFGYNANLLAEQAVSIGRSKELITDISIKLQGILTGVELAPSYAFLDDKLEVAMLPLKEKIDIPPVDALFNFEPTPLGRGKVIAFRISSDGREIDMLTLKKNLEGSLPQVLESAGKDKAIVIPIPVVVREPKIKTQDANNFGIKELLGAGTSKFSGSITNRVHNIQLAADRLNGALVPPGDTFSFNRSLGDVSKFTGYKEAFIIKDGKTILGDGGGVCQVSTTLFRAILNSGLPITERHAHSYRVGYYEQDAPPGLDATVYDPSADLKFKNDTGQHVLIQAYANLINSSLTFYLYGAGDGRKVKIEEPVIKNQTAPAPPLYTDDPSLPKGTIKQVDFAATGANVTFSRTVEKEGKVLISEKYNSNYRPWQAVYLRGTKE